MKLYIPMAKRPSTYDAPHIPLNYRVLRYADILLMYAEVENALGNDAEARDALNQVRARVELSDVVVSGTELRDAIRNERRLELALEDNRLYDLRRWKDDNGKLAIQNIIVPMARSSSTTPRPAPTPTSCPMTRSLKTRAIISRRAETSSSQSPTLRSPCPMVIAQNPGY